jgi:hypothetical protein
VLIEKPETFKRRKFLLENLGNIRLVKLLTDLVTVQDFGNLGGSFTAAVSPWIGCKMRMSENL